MSYFHAINAINFAGAFTPDDLPNVVRDYRADTGVTGSPVSLWAPRLGANTLTGTGGGQPAFVASDPAFNNEPLVSFNGTTNELLFAGGIVPLAPWTVFCVLRQVSMGTEYMLGQAYTSGGSFVRVSGASGTPATSVGIETAGTSWVSCDVFSPSVLALTYDGTNFEVFQNGVSQGSVVRAQNGSGSGTSFSLGSFGGGGFAKINVAQLTVCNAVESTPDIVAVTPWYVDRYNL